MTKVDSSNINDIEYDDRRNTLKVTFKNNTTFEYHGVSKDEYEKLMKASSIGAHFHKHIRNNKKYLRKL